MTTVINDNTAYAVKKFSVALTAAALKQPTDLTPLLGTPPKQSGAESIIKQQSSPQLPGILVTDLAAKKAGTQVTVEALDTLGGDAIMGDEMREGKGENVDISSMSLKIDKASKVINSVPGEMIDQRTKINLRSSGMAQLMGWFPRLLFSRTLVHLAGARGSKRSKEWAIRPAADYGSAAEFNRRMINPVLAPTFNRHYVASGGALVQGGQQLGSILTTDTPRLSHIDALAEIIDAAEFQLQPIRLPGDPAASYSPIRGVLYLDPVAYQMLLADTTAGYNIRNWQALAMERAKLMGQTVHPLFLGDCVMWNRIVIRPMSYSIQFAGGEATNIITAANRLTATETTQAIAGGITANFRVSRGILMGAQAFAVVQGNNDSGGTTASFKERIYDYGSKYEAMGEWMGSESKLRFSFKDSQGNFEPTDNGVYVVDFAIRNT